MARGTQELAGLLRGLQIVVSAVAKENQTLYKHLWSNSSIRELIEGNLELSRKYLDKATANPGEELKTLQSLLKETQERTCVVFEGAKQLSRIQLPQGVNMMSQSNPGQQPTEGSTSNTAQQLPPDAANLDISSITLRELEKILSKRSKDREVSLRLATTKVATEPPPAEAVEEVKPIPPNPSVSKAMTDDEKYVGNVLNILKTGTVQETSTPPSPSSDNIVLPKLSTVAKQRKVPSSRIGRMATFGSLFAGLGIGTINELTKGALGMGGSKNVKEALFSPANADRIVDTLCRVRGAALKIGQLLSIQDNSLVSPQLMKAFERVRQAADYMPDWQVEQVMSSELGADWRSKLTSFEQKPFAAASIGQVHRAVLLDGMELAIKIQYPGVAKSIESDIDNLVGMLKVWDVFPKGFFIDNFVKVAKRELAWEVDYLREAEYTERFKEMIAPYPEYYVPTVIKDMTTTSVLTTELVPGVPLDKCFQMSYEHRRIIAESTLKLCLRELFELQCMQTDPNWSNFLYDDKSKRLMLIDFGATRFYQKDFIKNYRHVIMCAANNDRKGVLDTSREMGFLTGYESKQMDEAHVDAVMILGEIFRYDGEFDFGSQNTTQRIATLVPTMVAHRLCPPPEEIYSIHRKLSGVFLLCSRLNVKMNCKPFYKEIIEGSVRN
ncbi:atypical kinase COQ8B, mitochondrial [Eupeodes corollae]|uniref:atypical kinase COQ8B, mitochondrial n=1 Tax=Eupeodes corollae TaxID=290404 RepID=UPI002490380F|nr:atypical kinase COQ8B, mitochondrial [Eupeodes corollae]XP_055904965.1 atypical kinase COQ8B, mitochondrial [Eupeodes corollae]